jgi:aminoglycoside phosphotransferase (APT) family kinase protein
LHLPDFPEVSADTVRTIAEQHGLGVQAFSRLPSTGVFNAIYLLDDGLVLRVPRNHPTFVAALAKEAIAVPAARAAGVHTPALVAFDDSLTLLPVPYAVYKRVHGEPLEQLETGPRDAPAAYRALGRDLTRLHGGVRPQDPAGRLGAPNLPQDDPRPLPERLVAAGYFSAVEARWLGQWLERLAPLLQTPGAQRFLHGDTQATNILVRPGSLDYLALVDWGGCGWGDPALDFSGCRCVPSRMSWPAIASSQRCQTMRPPKRASCGTTCTSLWSSWTMSHNLSAHGVSVPSATCSMSCASCSKHRVRGGQSSVADQNGC